jgi:cytochrome P450
VTDLIVSYDGAQHAGLRSIMNRLFVPSRLKANEAFMFSFADQLASEAAAAGQCDIVNEIGTPYVTLVIADLLGVPQEDRQTFREVIDAGPPPGNMDEPDTARASPALQFMAGYFARYIAERRAQPREDVLTELATATLPDGTVPDLMEVVKLAMFLFAAGQDTSAKLVGNAMRFILETPGLQERLRQDRALIAPFLEEVLRLEGSAKATFRLARRNSRIGDIEIQAGQKIVIALAAANRDPRRWPDPQALKIGREKIQEHLGFGRGAHVCVGAPLARVEVRVLFERLFEHTSNIRLDEDKHGGAASSQLEYEPSYIIRGLEALHLRLDPR